MIQISLSKNKINREVVQEKTGSTKGKLLPTASGEVLSDFLNDYFNQVVDYGWTANLENDFDKIALGEEDRLEVLDDFYKPFHKLIMDSGEIDRNAVAPAREIGVDPKTGRKVFARFGRFGPMIQLGDNKIETVSLENALKMFLLPRKVGKTEDGKEITANIGQYGPYIKIENTFVSIKPMSPFEITETEAQILYEEKLKADEKRILKKFKNGITISRGGFGRKYITDNEIKAILPKDLDIEKITEKQASELIEVAKSRKSGKKTTTRKSTKRKTSSKNTRKSVSKTKKSEK